MSLKGTMAFSLEETFSESFPISKRAEVRRVPASLCTRRGRGRLLAVGCFGTALYGTFCWEKRTFGIPPYRILYKRLLREPG